jgi:hypothetical protein
MCTVKTAWRARQLGMISVRRTSAREFDIWRSFATNVYPRFSELARYTRGIAQTLRASRFNIDSPQCFKFTFLVFGPAVVLCQAASRPDTRWWLPGQTQELPGRGRTSTPCLSKKKTSTVTFRANTGFFRPCRILCARPVFDRRRRHQRNLRSLLCSEHTPPSRLSRSGNRVTSSTAIASFRHHRYEIIMNSTGNKADLLYIILCF